MYEMIQNLFRYLSMPLATLISNLVMVGPLAAQMNTDGLATPTIVSEPRFAGFSNDAVAADSGLAGMHEACASTFGEGARMCLDIEVFKTPGLRSVSAVTRAWLQPTSLLSGDNPGSLSCNGWSVTTGSAATWLTGDMQIIYASKHHHARRYDSRRYQYSHCENSLPVTCCK